MVSIETVFNFIPRGGFVAGSAIDLPIGATSLSVDTGLWVARRLFVAMSLLVAMRLFVTTRLSATFRCGFVWAISPFPLKREFHLR
jgi:hypothetical protein